MPSVLFYVVETVTAEVASSSLVVPAIPNFGSYACGSIFAWAQKGTNSVRGVKFRAQLPYNKVYVHSGLAA
jgi:hypothetical protein